MNINKYQDTEFNYLVKDILDNSEFQSLKDISHHGLNRYDHSYRVSYYSYKLSKLLKMDRESTARAALLHDFFYENENTYVDKKDQFSVLNNHPTYALNHAKKYFALNEKEENIIESHMFPFGKKIPKYKESWLVDIVDDIISLYEKAYSVRFSFSTAITFILCILVNSR